MNHIHWEDLSWIENFVPGLYLLSNNPMDTKGWGYLWGWGSTKAKIYSFRQKRRNEGRKGGKKEMKDNWHLCAFYHDIYTDVSPLFS